MAQRAVGHVGDAELARGRDQAVGFVHGFEGGVFGLQGVDVRDLERLAGCWIRR